MTNQATCPVCGGTGWKYLEKEGRSLVSRCECYLKSRVDRILAGAGIPARYEACSFESFHPVTPKLAVAKTLAMRFVEDYPVVDCGLLILGPCGVGKTHLAISILRALVDKLQISAVFTDFRDLLKRIQDSFNPVSHTSEMEILRPVLNTEVLVLDDLGAERPTEWVRDTFAYILNTRYNQKLTTILTSNFDDSAREAKTLSDGSRVRHEETLTDRIGERLRSRLYEMCKVIRIEGSDFRIEVKQAQYQF
ncbi:MAG: ATP-binding protein [Acidobacteriota bacterium]